MGNYYIDYENFATRKERLIRTMQYIKAPKLISGRESRKKEQKFKGMRDKASSARNRFLVNNDIPKNVKLKGDYLDNIEGTASDRIRKNAKLGLRGWHYTWGERKAARIDRNNREAKRRHILKNAVVKD